MALDAMYIDIQTTYDCKAVHLFTMDFSKAFDSVNHSKLSAKLKQLPSILTSLIGTIAFLFARQQQIFYNNHLCNWKVVNKGTTQGSVSGPYLFNIFLNDLEISYNNAPASFKYADDSKMVSPLSNQCDPSANLMGHFMAWSKENNMPCNPKKCKELIFRSRGNNSQYNPAFDISQCSSLVLLVGV